MPKNSKEEKKTKKEKVAKPPFRKVLIANRGEIACRIIRTCQRMGIKTVAVYSEADAKALHVAQADEAVLIGPPPALESYLDIDAVLQAARDTGAQAIHPGYGFLSENPAFAQACESEGVIFIGPSAEVMSRMKDKAQARGLAAEAGLPLLPGTGSDITPKQAVSQAEAIGFPIMVKAARGGGGIGIRLVREPEDLLEALKRSKAFAESAFGSSGVYLEKYLEKPSHVEVQVLADHHGNAVHLFERDCSVQRRNQKVIEETPCIKLDKKRLSSMYQAALALVSHVGYTNAGTVEFIVDEEGDFYFMEMNTRLQVEHPITEMVTGLDIVEHQLHIAAGEPLAVSQKDVRRRGHAIEARIYPEDPSTMIPASGIVQDVVEPKKDEHLRIDSALFPGYEVTIYYDSLMAKVITWSRLRRRAINYLRKALQEYQITGITHNIPVILRVLEDEEFRDGKYSTRILDRLASEDEATLSQQQEREAVAAVTAALGTVFGAGGGQRPSPWKTYGRNNQMRPGPGRGGTW